VQPRARPRRVGGVTPNRSARSAAALWSATHELPARCARGNEVSNRGRVRSISFPGCARQGKKLDR
jgi:hypothetical protein